MEQDNTPTNTVPPQQTFDQTLTPVEPQNQQTPQQSPIQPKKSNKKRLVLFAILAVIVIGGASEVILLKKYTAKTYDNSQKSKTTQKTGDPNNIKTREDLEALKQQLQTTVTKDEDKIKDLKESAR